MTITSNLAIKCEHRKPLALILNHLTSVSGFGPLIQQSIETKSTAGEIINCQVNGLARIDLCAPTLPIGPSVGKIGINTAEPGYSFPRRKHIQVMPHCIFSL